MTFSEPMPSARLKELWRELQRTPEKSDRYKELVELIRAESAANPASTDVVVNHLSPPPPRASTKP
jgi:hypothetical protein